MHHPVLIAGCDCTEADCLFVCDTCGADFGRHPAKALAHVCPAQCPAAPPFVPHVPPPVASAANLQRSAFSVQPSASPCPPGCQLSRLLADLGQHYTPDCGCSSEAARMDAGQTTPEQTLEVMRAEAAKRGLRFIESQARWLIELAHQLAADGREPTRLERIRLKAMRLAVRLLDSAPPGQ